MKNIQNLNSNSPRPKGDITQQLLDLKEWSQNPERYERRLNFRAGQAKNKKIVKSEDPVPRNAKEKQIKLAKKPLPKDWQPQYLNGNVIDLKPLIDDSWWLIKPEKPEDEDTSIPIEEKINQIAHKRKLAENKLFGLNEEFAKQKLREQMS